MWDAINNPVTWFFFSIATAVSFTYWNSEKYRLQEIAHNRYVALAKIYKVKLPEELEEGWKQQSEEAKRDIGEADKKMMWSSLGLVICIILFFGSL